MPGPAEIDTALTGLPLCHSYTGGLRGGAALGSAVGVLVTATVVLVPSLFERDHPVAEPP